MLAACKFDHIYYISPSAQEKAKRRSAPKILLGVDEMRIVPILHTRRMMNESSRQRLTLLFITNKKKKPALL